MERPSQLVEICLQIWQKFALYATILKITQQPGCIPVIPHSPIQHSDAENEGTERLENSLWCSCRECDIMPTAKECIYCVEESELENKLEGWTM